MALRKTANRSGGTISKPPLETKAPQWRERLPWVFHGEGHRVVSIRQAWRTACTKAGLVGHIPHDFRRSPVRRFEEAGVPRSVAMRIIGHSSEAIYLRYSISNDADVREGLAKVAALPKPKTASIRHLANS